MKLENEEGQAMVEFAIAFPLLLIFILGILQIGLIINACSIVNYAAFCACRAGIVHNANDSQMKLAASIACTPIAGNLAISFLKTSIKKELIETGTTIPVTVLKVTVTHRYKLIFPVVNKIFSLIWNRGQVPHELFRGRVPIKWVEASPSIPVKATCAMRMEK